MALAGKDEADDWSSNAKKRQEHFEAETERILMDTYNSLYKCQEFVPQVWSCRTVSSLLQNVWRRHFSHWAAFTPSTVPCRLCY